jgi:PAS domain S-box-containing protein
VTADTAQAVFGKAPSESPLSPRLAQLAVDNTEDAIVIVGPRGPTLAVVYVNRGFRRMFGYSAEEIVGKPLGILAGAPLRVDGVLELSFDSAHPHRQETKLRTRDGDEILTRIDLQTIELEEGLGGLLVIRDVTEYRRLEHIASAVEVSESVGSLCAGIRHELGNPLNSLKAVIAVLGDAQVQLPSDRRADYLRRALGEIKRIESLLEQLRTFNGSESAQLKELDVEPFLQRFARLASSDCEARGTSLELLCGPAASIAADERLLGQILFLLLSNALDAIGALGPGAPPERRRIQLGWHRETRATRITLTDTGSGMTPNQLLHAERPFVTSKPRGTGLGLPLARKFASLTKCILEIQSCAGAGTTCCLTFESLDSSGSRPF